ncbi:MAG: hypothetical protein ACO3DO_05895, partial [Candidatus Nanopelagicales bacterium]
MKLKHAVLILATAVLLAGCSQEEKFGSLENNQGSQSDSTKQNSNAEQNNSNSEMEIPAVIENLGFKLAGYDAATGNAGDLKIKGVNIPVAPENDPNKDFLNESYKYLMSRYGANDMGRPDVQMSFFLPLGTKVISMVSGTVCDVTKLYSDDVSIRIAPTGLECFPEGQGGANILFE